MTSLVVIFIIKIFRKPAMSERMKAIDELSSKNMLIALNTKRQKTGGSNDFVMRTISRRTKLMASE